MRIKIMLTILFVLFIFTSCEQDTATIETTDLITSETSREITETTTTVETMPPDIIPQTTDIINILKHSGNSPDRVMSGYDLLYDTCGYIQLDLSDLDPSIIYADGNFYSDNLLIGSINPTITYENLSVTDLTIADIMPDNINAGKITYAFELPPMNQPRENDFVYKAYTVDAENYYIHFPLINDDSPEIREFNIKFRDEFFANLIENRDTILTNESTFYYNSLIVGDCLGITIDQTKYYNPYSLQDRILNPYEFNVQYYYNLKAHRIIDFDEFLWHGLLLQLNSDEFYETYFSDHIDRNYVITREADHIEVVYPPEIVYDENEAVPAPAVFPDEHITIKFNLKNTTPLEISVRNRPSSFNKDLFIITTDKPFDPTKYPVADKPNEIINTAYSHTFATKYDDVLNGTFYNNFNIPQINSDKPEAVRLNQEIIDYLFTGSVYDEFKLMELNRGDCMNTVTYTRDYTHIIDGNTLVIRLYSFGGLLGSDSFTAYKFIYYDYVNDRELTCEEYLKEIGYTMQDIADILNSAPVKNMYGGYSYYYGEDEKFMTPDDIGGVSQRDDGTLEIMVLINTYGGNSQLMVTSPHHEEDGFQFFVHKRMVNVPNYNSDRRGEYTGLGIIYPYGEIEYHNIQSDIPYNYYIISDTESAALGVTETTIEFSTSPYFTLVINIDDILRHHSADMKYENVTAKITGMTDNKITIPYEIDSISGTIYFDLTASTAYFEGSEDRPFFKRSAADYINGSDIYLPQQMLTVSLDTPYEFTTGEYTYENNIERFFIGTEYRWQILKVYNFTDTKNQTPESMLAALDYKIHSKKNIISDNLMTCNLLSVYREGENIYEYTNGYAMIYKNDDTAFFIVSEDYGEWNHETDMWEVMYRYEDFIKFAESLKISRG